jgi:hypothetical protein
LKIGVLDFSIRFLYLGVWTAFGFKPKDKVLPSGTLALAHDSVVKAVTTAKS